MRKALRTLAVLSILGLVVATTGSVGATPVSRTTTSTVAPVDAHGHLIGSFKISRTRTGTCEPGSDALPGWVYRCSFDNFVIDPCWAVATGSHAALAVVCLTHPWSRTLIRLRTGSLARGSGPPADSTPLDAPWGLELANGRRCLAAQGTHDTFHGRVVDFYCGKTLALLHGIDRSRGVWRIGAVRVNLAASHPDDIYTALPDQQVRQAWYGDTRAGAETRLR